MKTKKDLLDRLAALGFPLMETKKEVDANATLAEVVKSDELRLWEGFPVLLMHSAKNGLFDYVAVKNHLTSAEQETLDNLFLMSLVLYRDLGLKFSWTKKLYHQLPFDNMDKEFRDSLFRFQKLKRFRFYNKDCDTVLEAQRLKNTFQSYLQETNNLNDVQSQKENFGLEYALSQVFSPKQKELFLKRLRGENLTKTEREYYSRRVKKKVVALANEKLHQLAKSLTSP